MQELITLFFFGYREVFYFGFVQPLLIGHPLVFVPHPDERGHRPRFIRAHFSVRLGRRRGIAATVEMY